MVYSIYAESTPNPQVMKFVSNRMLFNNSIEISSIKDTKNIKKANLLVKFAFIKSLFLSSNFISITKTKDIEWVDIAMHLRTFINDFLNENKLNDITGDTITSNNTKSTKENNTNEKKLFSEDEKKIEKILDEYIAPAVEGDGGSISLDSFKDGIVTVILEGACNGCPSSTITLKQGIETLLKEKMKGKIKEVCAK